MVKYGFPIGVATEDIAAGSWLHSHNLRTQLEGLLGYEYRPDDQEELRFPTRTAEIPTFDGYRRDDGRAGTRNESWILNTDCGVKLVAVGSPKRASEAVRTGND